MRRVLNIVGFILAMFICMSAKSSGNIKEPDFAFPKKVQQQAVRDLEKALSADDGAGVVNALVRIGLAESAVSSDSLPNVLSRVEEVKSREQDPVTRSMLSLLEAQIYTDIYANDRWKINQRPEIAAQAVTDDYNLWGRNRFFKKVSALVDEALADKDALRNTPLGDYSNTLVFQRSALTVYPTMLDFAVYRALAYMSVFSDSFNRTLTVELLRDPMNEALYPNGSDSVERRVLEMYRMLMEGREESASGLFARAKVMEYIYQRIFTFERNVFSFRNVDGTTNDVHKVYMEIYDKLKNVPYAVELLLAMPDVRVDSPVSKELYGLLSRFEHENPQYFNLNGVKELMERLTMKSVTLRVPKQVQRQAFFTVEIEGQNVNSLKLNLYKLPSSSVKRDSYYYAGSLGKAINTVEVSKDGEAPFTYVSKAALSAPDYGYYVVVPEFDGKETIRREYEIINCSDLATGVVQGVGEMKNGVVRNVGNGEPVKGASLIFSPWDRRTASSVLPRKTDARGFVGIDVKKSGTLYATLGNDLYSSAVSIYDNERHVDGVSVYGSVVTSLGLYRPGDRMDYAVVLYEVGKDGRKVIPARRFNVCMRDANYQEVGTQEMTTDAWGRAQGSFDIPSGTLTGNFHLEFVDSDITGGCSFMVSDYKLPTFEVKVTSVSRPARIGNDAVIEGSARTFAGFPVEDATVKAQVKVRTGAWWFASVSPVFYEVEATVDSNGDFRIVIPSHAIANSPCVQGYFNVDMAVTSLDGETRTATAGFNMGKPDYIKAEIPGQYNAVSGKEVKVGLYNYDDKPQVAELRYKISRLEKEGMNEEFSDPVKEGTIMPGNFSEIIAALPSGRYGVIFETVDTNLSEPSGIARFTVWRPDDTICAADQLLWIPESGNIQADANGRAYITVGSNAPGNHMLMLLSDDSGHIVSSQWIVLKGMQRLEIQLPHGARSMTASLSTIHDCKMATETVSVVSAEMGRKITVHTTTFRDKVTPGDKETVTLNVKGLDGANPESAVMLDMSNKAIEVIQDNPFSLDINGWYGASPYIIYPSFRTNWINASGKWVNYDAVDFSEPEFKLYGRRFGQSANFYIRGARRMAANMAMDTEEVAVEEEAADEIGVVREHKKEISMPQMKSAATAGDAGAGDMALAESEVVSVKGAKKEDDAVYRPAELPIAFFRPMLNTDAEGNLEITYTVPDANTTWVLKSLAYNRDLLTASDKVEIVASKPVMVSSNAPRFLRCGDKVRLLSSVMNATDSILTVHTVSELLSVGDQRLVAISENSDTIAAMRSTIAGIEFEVPEDLQGVILRVKSTAGHFTDGEQTFIPILPSEQNVVESKPFYIAPGNNHFVMPLPEVTRGRAMLKFTGNPAWEVVAALPGLRKSDFTSSVSAAGELYAAAVADGLMKQYPEIARTIRKWADNPSDSALVSMLEKNSQLKDMLLSSTPWVSDALNDSERMQRLVLLLDGRDTSKAINNALVELRKTFVNGEGWGWTTQYPQYSEWCTMQILDILGGLNRLGWLPENPGLKEMIVQAVKHIDSTTAAEYAKYPKGDFTMYCYMRLKYPDIKQSSASSAVTAAQVRRILSSWKDHSVALKAVDALILNANGYAATARQILESLTERDTSTPERGMWWAQFDNSYSMWSMNKVGLTGIVLDAYASVSPKASEVDRIRQWLVLNKADNSWGNAIITTQVISSLLMSGTEWTVNPAATAVRVNGTLIQPKEEYATGSFTETITPLLSKPGELVIDRQGNYPSFGGLVTMRVVPMNEVKSAGTDELKVEKYMSVYDGSSWVPSHGFKVGDRVKVTLTIMADKDMSYVVVNDKRAAGLEPKEQLPTPVYSDGLCFYRENRDSHTNLFINFLPKGTYMLEYELFASQAGVFSSGVAQVQSQYNPLNVAHSAGAEITIE